MIRRFLLRLLISALVLFGVAYFSQGALLKVSSAKAAVYAAVVLGLVNALVKPVVRLLTMPLTMITLGLFAFVLNALFLYAIEFVVPGFHTVGFLQTIVAAAVVSVATSLLSWLLVR